jgi:hypothetical protein
MLYYFGKSKLIPGAYAPGMYKTYFLKLKKFSKKISHVEGHVLCVHIKFHIQSIFFVPCVKKTKKISRETDYFSTKNLSFYRGHKTYRLLLKKICEHVTCQHIYEIFFLVCF